MKIYTKGTSVVVDTEIAGYELKYIPLHHAKFGVMPGDTIVIYDYTDDDDELTYKAPATQVKNEAGVVIGTVADIVDYLSKFVGAATPAANNVTHIELTNPVSVPYTGWKSLSFVCDGTIDVTINGVTIQYPKTFGSSPILGETLNADYISEYDVTFNGTGTVLITLQK